MVKISATMVDEVENKFTWQKQLGHLQHRSSELHKLMLEKMSQSGIGGF